MPNSKKTRPNSFQLQGLLASAAQRMQHDLHQQLIEHPGDLGKDREQVVMAFLRDHLPKRFEISSGFVFDVTGSCSEQIDIVISDPMTCPRFETAGGVRYYPCESVVAVGQVKSSLSSVDQLRQALLNLESAKALDRSSGGRAVDRLSGEPIDQTWNHRHQIFTFLFVVGRALSRELATDTLMDFILERDACLWPNICLALNKFLLTFCCDAGVCPNPLDARGVASQPADDRQDLLMRFYLLLAQAIEVTAVSPLPYYAYLRKMGDWTADVHSSTKDDPPPFLSSLSI